METTPDELEQTDEPETGEGDDKGHPDETPDDTPGE